MTAPAPLPEQARQLPPPLVVQMPLCPVCGEAVHAETDGYACDRCLASWPYSQLGGVDESAEGEWLEPLAPRCEALVQPWVDNRWVSGIRQAQVFQCVLAAGHVKLARGDDRGDHLHAHPEVTGAVCVRGWR